MALDLGPGKGYLVAAIVLGIVVVACQLFGFALGVVGTILLVAIVVLMIAWILKIAELI